MDATSSLDAHLAPTFRIIRPIGRGGMAEVLLVARRSLNDPAAAHGTAGLAVMKRIWPELASDADFRAMFLDEARLALELHHPNIVQSLELGHAAGAEGGSGAATVPAPYLMMEYLAGHTLAQVLARLRGLGGASVLVRPLRLRVLTLVLRALDHAHRLVDAGGRWLRVVHRDVSPSNVFLTYDGRVKLMDFGIAKSLLGEHRTRPGVFKGRFAYVAPEQLRSRPIDRRADVFSAGVVLWELLADQRLFRGLSDGEIVHRLTSGEPAPPLPAEIDLPAELRALCAQALAIDPDARPPTAGAFADALMPFLAGSAREDLRRVGEIVGDTFAAERQAQEQAIRRFFGEERRAGQRSGAAVRRGGRTSGSLPAITVPVRRGPLPAPASLEPRGARTGWVTTLAASVVLMAGGLAARAWLREAAPNSGSAAVPWRSTADGDRDGDGDGDGDRSDSADPVALRKLVAGPSAGAAAALPSGPRWEPLRRAVAAPGLNTASPGLAGSPALAWSEPASSAAAPGLQPGVSKPAPAGRPSPGMRGVEQATDPSRQWSPRARDVGVEIPPRGSVATERARHQPGAADLYDVELRSAALENSSAGASRGVVRAGGEPRAIDTRDPYEP